MRRFAVVKKYEDKNLNLPERKTKESAGYDFEVAEDIVIPPYISQIRKITDTVKDYEKYTLNDVARITKQCDARPTLVPTGIKVYLEEGEYLELSMRSSAPLKHWLIMGNSVGKIFGQKIIITFY